MRLLALFAVTFSTVAGALPPETWIVAIGNNDGMGTDATLLFAETDATAVADAFRVNARVPGARVQTVLGESADAVRRSLLDLNVVIRSRVAAGTASALIVFYSGHADATALHLGTTQFQLDELKELVEGSAAGVRILIVDACRSGAITRVKGVSSAPTFALDLKDAVATEGTAILTSSASSETSQESDSLGGSIFTHHFVNALRGAADLDGDGDVTLSEAYSYTYAQTLRSSGETVTLQHPTYAYDVKGKGVLVLSRPAEAQGRVGRIVLARESLHLFMRDRREGPVVAEVVPQGNKRVLSLPAQKYFIQERRPSEFFEYEVTLEPGATVELSTVQPRVVRYDRLVRQRGATASVQWLALGGLRGPVISGGTIGPSLTLGGALDLPFASFGARVRGFTGSGVSTDQLVSRRDLELGIGPLISKSIDVGIVSVSVGVSIEYLVLHQQFTTARVAPPRTASGAAFSIVLGAEVPIAGSFGLRLEGGPMAVLFPLERAETGTVTLQSGVSGFATAGLVWHQ